MAIIKKIYNIQKAHWESKHLAKIALSDDILKLNVLPLQDRIGEGLWGGLGPPGQGQSSRVKLQNGLFTLRLQTVLSSAINTCMPKVSITQVIFSLVFEHCQISYDVNQSSLNPSGFLDSYENNLLIQTGRWMCADDWAASCGWRKEPAVPTR